MAVIIDAICVRAPEVKFTAVREKLPATGTPPKVEAPIFVKPSPMSSRFGETFSLLLLAIADPIEILSINTTMAINNADGRSSPNSARERETSDILGSPTGTAPTTGTEYNSSKL